MISCERTYDIPAIRDVMILPEMWATVAEDGRHPDLYIPDVHSDCWLRLEDERDELIGYYRLHPWNSVTLQIHAQVLPDKRRDYSIHAGYRVLKWFLNEAPEKYSKMVAVVPSIYPNVVSYAKNFGFRDEGLLTKSYRKNGYLVDTHILGVTKNQVREVVNEQCG